MSRKHLLQHLARAVIPLVVLVTAKGWQLATVAALALHLGAFAFCHDLVHGALRLPRRWTEWLLFFAALPMLVSGHSMRLTHLRHHARPLAPEDLEGQGATVSFWRAVWLGPSNAAALRVEGWRLANTVERRWILAELVLLGLSVGLASLTASGRVWLVVSAALQLSASVWASHLSHHPPALLREVALRLSWTRSAVLLSLAFHHEHHARPRLPCAALQRSEEAASPKPCEPSGNALPPPRSGSPHWLWRRLRQQQR
jgi:fatty acid desaturase